MNMSGTESDPRWNEDSRYILFTGAPGSRWSGVANSIYWSKDFDHSDASEDRSYAHNGSQLHCGAYFDPRMEFPLRKNCFDLPFSSEGVGKRLIKSHTLATKLVGYRDYPIIMVHRNDYKCWDWWNEAGGFNIKYPKYDWYMNQSNMFREIQKQNNGIMSFIYKHKNSVTEYKDNYDLLGALNMSILGVDFEQFKKKDVEVYLYKPTL